MQSLMRTTPISRLALVAASTLLCANCLLAQFFLPSGAQVDLCFPHIADGGDASQRWQTTFFFVNPNSTTASGTLAFYGQDGRPISMTFGTTASTAFSVTVPAGGSVRLRTTGTGGLRVGWAYATFDKPVQGNAAYRVSVNETPRQEVAVNATLPTPLSINFANGFSSAAIANPWSNVNVTAQVTLINSSGRTVATKQITLGPLQQTAQVVWSWFGLDASTFEGSIKVYPEPPAIVLVINADAQFVLSSMPSGHVAGYIADQSAIRMVFRHLVSVLNSYPDLAVGQPQLVLEAHRVVNAWAVSDNTVHIELGLSQLLRSTDELAFVVAHELGHIWQYNHRRALFSTGSINAEDDADIFGLLAILFAGYDPYAAGGFFGKLMMATSTASLLVQLWEDQNKPDAHYSASTRIDFLDQRITALCADPSVADFCRLYNQTFHPNVPGPLVRPPTPLTPVGLPPAANVSR